MKAYEVIVNDEWENNYQIGFYNSLDNKDLLNEINSYFKDKVLIDENGEKIEKFELKPGDLKEYVSTYGECFNKNFNFSDETFIKVYGFIYDLDSLIKGLEELRK